MNPSESSRVVVFTYGSNMLVARMQERAPLSKPVSVGQLVPEEAEIVVVKQVELQARTLQAEELTIPSIQGTQPVVNGSHLS